MKKETKLFILSFALTVLAMYVIFNYNIFTGFISALISVISVIAYNKVKNVPETK